MFSFFRKKAAKLIAKQDGSAEKDGNRQKDGVARESDANKKTCEKRASLSEERVENTRQVLQKSSKNTHTGFSESEASVVAIPASNSYASTHNERKQRNYEENLTCNEPKLNEIPGKLPDDRSVTSPTVVESSIHKLLAPSQRVNSDTNNKNDSKNTTLCVETNNSKPFLKAVTSPSLTKSESNALIKQTFFNNSNSLSESNSKQEVSVDKCGQKSIAFVCNNVFYPVSDINESKNDQIPVNSGSEECIGECNTVQVSDSCPPVIGHDLQTLPKINSLDCLALDSQSDKENGGKLAHTSLHSEITEDKLVISPVNLILNTFNLNTHKNQQIEPLVKSCQRFNESRVKFLNFDESNNERLCNDSDQNIINIISDTRNSHDASEKCVTTNVTLLNKQNISDSDVIEHVSLNKCNNLKISENSPKERNTEKTPNRKGSLDITDKKQHFYKNASNTISGEEGEKFTKQNRKSKDFYSAFFDTKKKIVDSNEIPQTNKEVINLLLPEDCVNYKKEESYFSKTGVQNFFDKMAGGKRKGRSKSAKNKNKQNFANNDGGRSWSFSGLKSKESTAKNETPVITSKENDLKSNDDSNSVVVENILTAETAIVSGEINYNNCVETSVQKNLNQRVISSSTELDNNIVVSTAEDDKHNHVNVISKPCINYGENCSDNSVEFIKHELVDHPVSENSLSQRHLQDENNESCSSNKDMITNYDNTVENDTENIEIQLSELNKCQSVSTIPEESSVNTIIEGNILKDNIIDKSEFHETVNSIIHIVNGEPSTHTQNIEEATVMICESNISVNPINIEISDKDSTIEIICKQTEGQQCLFKENLSMSSEKKSNYNKPAENVNEGISLCDFNDPVNAEAVEKFSTIDDKQEMFCNINANVNTETLNVEIKENNDLTRELDLNNDSKNSCGIINKTSENSTELIVKDTKTFKRDDINVFKETDRSDISQLLMENDNYVASKMGSDNIPKDVANPITLTGNQIKDIDDINTIKVHDPLNSFGNNKQMKKSVDENYMLQDLGVNISASKNDIFDKIVLPLIDNVKEMSMDETFICDQLTPLENAVEQSDNISTMPKSCFVDDFLYKKNPLENIEEANSLSDKLLENWVEPPPFLPEMSSKNDDIIEMLDFEIVTPVDNEFRDDIVSSRTEIDERGVKSNASVTSREPSGIFANSVDERKEFISGAKIPQYDTKCDSASIKTTHEIIESNENISAIKFAVSNQEQKENEPERERSKHDNNDSIDCEQKPQGCANTEIDLPKLLISTSCDSSIEAVNSVLTDSDLFWKPPGLPAANRSVTEQMGGADSKQKDRKKSGRGSPPRYTNFDTPDRRSARESFSLPPDDFRVAGVSKRGSLNSLPGSSKLVTNDRRDAFEDDFKNIYLKDDNRRMGQLSGEVVASSNDSGIVLEKHFKNDSKSFINSSNIKYDLYGNEIKENMDYACEEGSSEDSGIIKSDVTTEHKVLKHILRDSIFGEDYTDDTERMKKKVTFDTVINFDDGDRINDENLGEDDSAVDSFASFEEIEEDDEEFEIENEEAPIVILAEHDFAEVGYSKKLFEPHKNKDPLTKLFKSKSLDDVSNSDDFKDARCVIDEVENNENLGLENDDSESGAVEIVEVEDDSSEKSDSLKEETVDNLPLEDIFKDIVQEAFKNVIETKQEIKEEIKQEIKEDTEDEESGSEESYEEVEEEEEEEEDTESCEEEVSEVCSESLRSEPSESDKLKNSEVEKIKQRNETRINNNWRREEEIDDSAYADMLRIFEKQLRGLADKEGRLADLQERAAALHRVQGEVCNARKEAELVRQKLRHVEADLAATRSRNCHLLDQLELKADEARAAEKRAEELSTDAMRWREQLDRLLPECEDLRKLANTLSQERDNERKDYEQALARERSDREEREKTWHDEFERLRSQGAEREELLLADCEWKLRDVQKAARDRCARAEQRLEELQKAADERCKAADKHLEEMTSLKSTSHDQQRTIRQGAAQLAQLQASQSSLQQETTRLRTLLDMEKDALATQRSQHAKELEEKDRRLAARLEEQAKRLEEEWRAKHEQKEQDCAQHAKAIKEAQEKVEVLKKTLAKKETLFEESLDKAKTRADWELLEMRRILDKADIKYAEAVERLQDDHASETERLTEESEKRIKELETNLSSQACSARATLELVRGQLRSEHADALQRLKEAHRADMEKQWELFMDDKEQCLERMKAECMLEGEEDREKRDKQLLRDIEELKSSLAAREGDLGVLKSEAKKANEARVSAERRLSEAQVSCAARETATRAEAARQAETAQREAKETIDHLNKKCVCLSNLFEDMRSRWQQAPGEAAQLRRALQDERARAAALRRQLDAMSRAPAGDGSTATGRGDLQQKTTTEATDPESSAASVTPITTQTTVDDTPLKSIAASAELTKTVKTKSSRIKSTIKETKTDSDIALKDYSVQIGMLKPPGVIKRGVKDPSSVVANKSLIPMNECVGNVKKDIGVRNHKLSDENASPLNENLSVKEVDKMEPNGNIKNDTSKTQKAKEKQGYCNFIEANINNVSLNRIKTLKTPSTKLEVNRTGQIDKIKHSVSLKDNLKSEIKVPEASNKNASLESNNFKTVSRLGINKIGMLNRTNIQTNVSTKTVEVKKPEIDCEIITVTDSVKQELPVKSNFNSNETVKVDSKYGSQKSFMSKENAFNRSLSKSLDKVGISKIPTIKPTLKIDPVNDNISINVKEKPNETIGLPKDNHVDKNVASNADKKDTSIETISEAVNDKSFGAKFLKTFLTPGTSTDDAPPKRMVLTGGVRKAASLFDKKDKVKPTNSLERLGVNETSGVDSESGPQGWLLAVSKQATKRKGRVILSPPRDPPVELPQVTVPVRIRQFDPYRHIK